METLDECGNAKRPHLPNSASDPSDKVLFVTDPLRFVAEGSHEARSRLSRDRACRNRILFLAKIYFSGINVHS